MRFRLLMLRQRWPQVLLLRHTWRHHCPVCNNRHSHNQLAIQHKFRFTFMYDFYQVVCEYSSCLSLFSCSPFINKSSLLLIWSDLGTSNDIWPTDSSIRAAASICSVSFLCTLHTLNLASSNSSVGCNFYAKYICFPNWFLILSYCFRVIAGPLPQGVTTLGTLPLTASQPQQTTQSS